MAGMSLVDIQTAMVYNGHGADLLRQATVVNGKIMENHGLNLGGEGTPWRGMQMNKWVELWERPAAGEVCAIAGWHQWADAGSVSSGLPRYLVNHTGARKIGRIRPRGFYLFQIPGTHHLLRPEVKLADGHRQEMRTPRNEFFYTGAGRKGLVIFLGEEPHMNEARYAAAFFDAMQELGVSRVVALGGVYGEMPYDKDREVSCIYSLPHMKEELAKYAVRFSNYEGGTTIGAYLAHKAEPRGVEFVVFNAFVPAYNFSEAPTSVQGLRVEHDFRAWFDLMKRLNHMFDLGLDLSDLERQGEELTASMDAKIAELRRQMPELRIDEYLAKVGKSFTERPFIPLDAGLEEELRDLLDELEDG